MGRFGDFVKAKRIEQGLTLRQFCLEHDLDPGNTSKLERGLLAAPQGDKLEEYGRRLGLREGSEDWFRFLDLAAAESGRIPKDILSDEDVVDKLPVLFRTLRGKKVSNEKLDKLVRKIKGLKD